MYSRYEFNKGIRTTVIFGLLFFVSLLLPWFNRGYYSISFEFPLGQAIEGETTDVTLNTEPMPSLQGYKYLDIYISEYSIVLYLITLITTIICVALCFPLKKFARKDQLTKIAAVQVGSSILGSIPFFFIPKELEKYRLILERQMREYPHLDTLSSSMSFGIILAMIGAVGLIWGAIKTWREIRKKKNDAAEVFEFSKN